MRNLKDKHSLHFHFSKMIKPGLILCLLIAISCCKNDPELPDEEDENIVYISNDELLITGSLNIRYSNDNDGANNWEYRKQWVADFVSFFDFDVIGFQEEKHDQTTDLRVLLAEEYSTIGEPSSTQPGYEYNGIYYKRNRVELIESGRFWLSETPDIESVGWDALYHRQVTWARFKHKITEEEFFVFNTHFSHVSETARENSAKLLKNRIQSIAQDAAAIATGDFNFWPETTAYNILTQDTESGAVLTEARKAVDNPYNANYTGHCFGQCYEDGKIVDYVFVNDKIDVEKYGIITEQRQELFLSDHYPVIAKLKLK